MFNSPFSNSRSVAELVIGELIALARQVGDRNAEMHTDVWSRSTHTNATSPIFEIRGKKLGIVGYGHIGSQLSVLAEMMGMQVIFYDILQIMPLGTAKPCATLAELLQTADFVTLHVPETPETKNMIADAEIALMRQGSFLINASRGSVVDIPALVRALKSGHVAGAAVDVYPAEPRGNGFGFETDLQGCKNVILTPHIGGSTEEAQSAIGVEVAAALVKYINYGTTLAAVNFPEIDLRAPLVTGGTPAGSFVDLSDAAKQAEKQMLEAKKEDGVGAGVDGIVTKKRDTKRAVRVLNVHQNVPGVLKQINRVLSEFHIEKQICDSKGQIGYVMADIRVESDTDLKKLWGRVNAMGENIVTRILY